MSTKKIPMRMCIGCRTMKPKRELIRIVKTPNDEILIDATNKISGRGAYICNCEECLLKAQKINALTHAFSVPVDKEIYSKLIKEREDLE